MEDFIVGLLIGAAIIITVFFGLDSSRTSNQIIQCSEKTGRTVSECKLIVNYDWEGWTKFEPAN